MGSWRSADPRSEIGRARIHNMQLDVRASASLRCDAAALFEYHVCLSRGPWAFVCCACSRRVAGCVTFLEVEIDRAEIWQVPTAYSRVLFSG